MTANAKKAIKIGSLCFLAYLAVYIAKNILAATSVGMMPAEGMDPVVGQFTLTAIQNAKMVYFYSYAVGQLINGFIGDKIKAKYMMSFGLAFAGLSNIAFAQFNAGSLTAGEMPIGAYIAYGCTGFFLAMIYGPMTKVVSENTEMPYTTRCSLGYTIASYLGSPAASLFALIFVWESAFTASSIALIVMATAVFLCFTVYEKKGIITYGRFKAQKAPKSEGKIAGLKNGVKVLVKRDIIKFALIAMLTGVIRTALVGSLTTYFRFNLGFTADAAKSIFGVATVVIATASFIVIFLYEKLGHNLDKTLVIMFSTAAVLFTLTWFITNPYVNIVLIVLSIMASNGAATMLWSRYCPSLRDTGFVSSATGFLDFLSYMAAGTMEKVTPTIVKNNTAWGNMMLVCVGLMLVGVAISIPWKKILKKNA